MTPRSVALLVGCGALFGLSYVLVRDLVPVLGPVAVTAGRTLVGGLVLLAVARIGGQAPQWRRWPAYLLLGALAAAVPFSLISVSMLSLDAGTAAVLNASSPLFALAIDAVTRRRWPRAVQFAGLALAVGGVAVTMAARGLRLGDGGLVGVLAGLAGAAVFAYAGFFAAHRFTGQPPVVLAAGQQLAACALLAPALLVFPARTAPAGGTALTLLALGLFGSALAYLVFYKLIAAEGPARAANVNLLVPVFGVLWGRVLLGEPVPPDSVAGMAAVVGGLALVLRERPGAG